MENLGVKVQHVFSCDSHAGVKAVATTNFHPTTYFDNVQTRNNKKYKLGVDLYVAGFPCQPFSAQGKGEGARDPRGLIIKSIARYIHECRPKAFLLENVPGLVTQHKETFQNILSCLELVGKGAYNVKHSILDAAHHGIPQHRPRLFIVGVDKQWDKGTFVWPANVGCVDLEAVLDPKDKNANLNDKPPQTQRTAKRNWVMAIKKLIKKGIHPFRTNCVINIDGSKATPAQSTQY